MCGTDPDDLRSVPGGVMPRKERIRDRILALLADGSELTPDEMAQRL
jgi:hypothetical protein